MCWQCIVYCTTVIAQRDSFCQINPVHCLQSNFIKINIYYYPPIYAKVLKVVYRVNIKSFSVYKHLLQENYVGYKHIFIPLLQLFSKISWYVFIVTFGFWMRHFQTGGLREMVRHPGHHDHRISPPLTSFYGGTLRTKCFRHQFQILQIWRQE